MFGINCKSDLRHSSWFSPSCSFSHTCLFSFSPTLRYVCSPEFFYSDKYLLNHYYVICIDFPILAFLRIPNQAPRTLQYTNDSQIFISCLSFSKVSEETHLHLGSWCACVCVRERVRMCWKQYLSHKTCSSLCFLALLVISRSSPSSKNSRTHFLFFLLPCLIHSTYEIFSKSIPSSPLALTFHFISLI